MEVALASNPKFRRRFDGINHPDLNIDAMVFILYLIKDESYCSFVIDITVEGIEFFQLAELGFFVRTGNRYQMSIPESITPESTAAALERLLHAIDDDGVMHHAEKIILCMPRSKAEEWQDRLGSLSDEARLADRNILLGLEPNSDGSH